MAISPYPVDPYLTGLAIAYRNPEYIADEIAPYRTVGKKEFQWDNYAIGDMFTQQDTKVGRLSKPNQVTFSATRETDSTSDYALDSPIPIEDIENADANYNPQAHAAEGVMELVKLDREIRLASTVQRVETYLPTQRATLSGTDQWSDYTNSDPKSVMLAAFDACLLRPNTLIMGRAAWTIIRQHPKIVQAIRPTDSGEGAVTREELADLLEVDRILVGVGWKNAAKLGQAFSKTRIWGKHVTAAYINPQAQLAGTVTVPTFMLTARFGTPVSGAMEDKDVGMRGGVRVRSGESVKEVLVSQQGSYYWNNAVA
ncbi:hypothetical protein [Vacuolonema iberomarrocanum]|uniref:hypothetical protein n=1 Tax=Vacuolonema iberomarrocanum TaxID=3454632 RepID=UPI0019E4D42E|nr:phage capsid protein [filamentous cyanobacterium LEGE 07170]